ncbi:hypothetical protein GGS20DRAFT_275679 [Poronia punctata]|nr:hypothetical protein GGS20DRAFT_275679 [Poronia punctata]
MRSPSPEDTEGLLPKEEQQQQQQYHEEPPRKRTTSYSSIITISILTITNIITIILLFLLPSTKSKPSRCVNTPPKGITPTLSHLATTSPQLINVTFYPDDLEETPWRQHNSTKADDIWADYEQADKGFIMIPKSEAQKADIDPSRHAYIDRPDLNMVGYPVLPEAVHQMHCVNLLRKNLYYNVQHSRDTCKPPTCVPAELEGWDIMHIDHCLEIIRHRIACTADLGIVPFIWIGDTGKLTGENKRMHTCGNYDAIKQFVAENAVRQPPKGRPESLIPPEGAFIAADYDE